MSLREAFVKSLPKQHGTWFIFVTAYTMAHFIYQPSFADSLFLFLSMSFLIFAQSSLVFWVKSIKLKKKDNNYLLLAILYFLLAALPTFKLIIVESHYLLLLFAVVVGAGAILSLYLVYSGKELSVEAEILNISILSTVVPAVGYMAQGKITLDMLSVWIVTALFYLGSIFRVRYLIRDRKLLSLDFQTRLKANLRSLVYHSISYLVVVVMSMDGFLPKLMIIAFLPTFLRAVYIIARRYPRPPAVTRIGWAEVFNSVTFVVLSILAFRISP